MLVKILTPFVYKLEIQHSGDIVEIEDDFANKFIDKGFAIEVIEEVVIIKEESKTNGKKGNKK